MKLALTFVAMTMMVGGCSTIPEADGSWQGLLVLVLAVVIIALVIPQEKE